MLRHQTQPNEHIYGSNAGVVCESKLWCDDGCTFATMRIINTAAYSNLMWWSVSCADQLLSFQQIYTEQTYTQHTCNCQAEQRELTIGRAHAGMPGQRECKCPSRLRQSLSGTPTTDSCKPSHTGFWIMAPITMPHATLLW